MYLTVALLMKLIITAAVATDLAYNKNSILTKMNDHISKFDTTKACDVQYSPDEIAIILSRITKTATGSDGIPYWVFKECARELCNIISVLIDYKCKKNCCFITMVRPIAK